MASFRGSGPTCSRRAEDVGTGAGAFEDGGETLWRYQVTLNEYDYDWNDGGRVFCTMGSFRTA